MADDINLRIRQILTAVFGGGEPAAEGDTGLPQGMMTPDQADAEGRSLLDLRQSLVSGQLKLLDLQLVKDKFGAGWDRKMDQVHTICETVLKRHLANRHFFYRASDTAYVIVFDMADKGTATAACRAISQEILTKLLGREAANRSITMELNLAEIFPSDIAPGKSFTDAVESLLTAAPAEKVTPSSAAQQSHQASDTPARVQAEPKFTPIHLEKSAPAEPAFTPIHLEKHEHSRVMDADLHKILNASEREMDAWKPQGGGSAPRPGGGPQQSATAAKPAKSAVPELSFKYSPIWSAQKKAVISYQLNMTMQDSEGKILDPADIFTGEDEINLIRTVDRLVMKRGLADLSRAIAANRKYIACLPVTSYSLLERWGTPTILETVLTGLASPIPQLLVLDVVDAQVLERRELVQCATAAASKCRYLLLRASLDQTNFTGLAHPAVRAIGGSLRDHAWSEKDAAKKLDTFVTSAMAAKLETFLFGINSRSMAFSAIAAGFDYVSGLAIAPNMDEAGGVAPIDMLGLFK